MLGLRLWLVKCFVPASLEFGLFQIGSSSAMAIIHAQSICHGLDIPYFQTKVGIVSGEYGYTSSSYDIDHLLLLPGISSEDCH